jgi:hypothetical protein
MKSKLFTLTVLAALTMTGSVFTQAQRKDHPDHADCPTRDNNFHRTMDANMANAKEVTDRQAQDKEREQMRDHMNDGRVQVSFGSVGGSIDVRKRETSINYRVHPDRPDK